jgi:hypothetical protein
MARRRQAPGTWAVFYQQRLFLRTLLLSPDRRGRHVRGGRGRECRGTSFSPIALRILTATRPVVGRRYLQNAAVDPASRCQRSPKESHPGSPIEGRCGTVTGLLGAWSI